MKNLIPLTFLFIILLQSCGSDLEREIWKTCPDCEVVVLRNCNEEFALARLPVTEPIHGYGIGYSKGNIFSIKRNEFLLEEWPMVMLWETMGGGSSVRFRVGEREGSSRWDETWDMYNDKYFDTVVLNR